MPKKRDFTSWLQGEWVIVIALALLAVVSVGITREIIRRRAVGLEIAQLQAEVDRLRQRRVDLQRLVAEYQSAAAQEREARTKLNLGQPGEKALILERSSGSVAVRDTEVPSVGATDNPFVPSNPEKWWNYFFGS